MAYNISWILPRLKKRGRLWNCASTITLAVVGLFSKFVIVWLNKTTVYNKEGLMRAVYRPKGVPLITVSNHHSCFDDPGLWGLLDVRALGASRMRWSLAAHDICFTSAPHAHFFSLGKCVPVVRGAGVHQPAMDFCIERLRLGEWVHIFPEGRVNMEKEWIRLKWGVGRLLDECDGEPLVLPLWHEGMDRVLPNKEPYVLRARQTVVVSVGEAVSLADEVRRLRAEGEPPGGERARRELTDIVTDLLLRLRDRTHAHIHTDMPHLHPALTAGRTDLLVGPRHKLANGNHRHAHAHTDHDTDHEHTPRKHH